ncbi:MAG: AAA family ATPase [Acidobacteriota bacterium]
MRLREIKIANFKGLKAAEFAPTSFGCLVGENNAGKSSVLQAINYALKRSPSLPIELFYDPTKPVELSLQFDGVTEAHLRRLADNHGAQLKELIIDGKFEIFVGYQSPEAKCTVTMARSVPPKPQV